MSEHTNYFVIEAQSVEAAIGKLGREQVPCLVDGGAYLDGYPFPAPAGLWLVVSTYSDLHWNAAGQYYFDFKWNELCLLFEKVIELFEAEDGRRWRFHLRWQGRGELQKTFDEQQSDCLSRPELDLLAACFAREPGAFAPYLSYGQWRMGQFCDAVGIPYIHMQHPGVLPYGAEFYRARGYAVDVRTLAD